MRFRILKINELIKREVNNIILRELDLPPDIFLTILRVETENNIFSAKIFFSVIPEKKYKKAFEFLRKNAPHIQRLLIKRLKMKPVPRINFQYDKSFIAGEKVLKLLEEADA